MANTAASSSSDRLPPILARNGTWLIGRHCHPVHSSHRSENVSSSSELEVARAYLFLRQQCKAAPIPHVSYNHLLCGI